VGLAAHDKHCEAPNREGQNVEDQVGFSTAISTCFLRSGASEADGSRAPNDEALSTSFLFDNRQRLIDEHVSSGPPMRDAWGPRPGE